MSHPMTYFAKHYPHFERRPTDAPIHEPSAWLLAAAAWDPFERDHRVTLNPGTWWTCEPVQDPRMTCDRCGDAPGGSATPRLCTFGFEGRYKPHNESNIYIVEVALCGPCRIREYGHDPRPLPVIEIADGWEVRLDDHHR